MAKITYKEDQKSTEFEIPDGGRLYFEFEKRGVILKHGCLAGVCGSCCVEILQESEDEHPIGDVEADTLNAIKAELPADRKYRLACRYKIKGDLIFKNS